MIDHDQCVVGDAEHAWHTDTRLNGAVYRKCAKATCDSWYVASRVFSFDGYSYNWTSTTRKFTTMSPEHNTSNTSQCLTETELETIEVSAKLWGLLQKIVGDGPTRTADLRELMKPIHDIQRAVMSQGAARAYPGQLRALGENGFEIQGLERLRERDEVERQLREHNDRVRIEQERINRERRSAADLQARKEAFLENHVCKLPKARRVWLETTGGFNVDPTTVVVWKCDGMYCDETYTVRQTVDGKLVWLR